MSVFLALKTSDKIAEVYLICEGSKILDEYKWEAHKELSKTLLANIKSLLEKNKLTFKDLEGIVAFKGPGSFTGLRIGLTVANTISYSEKIPVIASKGDDWMQKSVNKIIAGGNDKVAMPFYGGDANITKPRK